MTKYMVYPFFRCRESDIIICSCELDDNCVEIHFLLKNERCVYSVLIFSVKFCLRAENAKIDEKVVGNSGSPVTALLGGECGIVE